MNNSVEKFRLSSTAVFSPLEENQACLLDTYKKKFYVLNALGLFILRQLHTWQTLETLIANVCKQYQVSKTRCQHDVKKFVKTLNRARLIEIK